jgi:hypothetical protein
VDVQCSNVGEALTVETVLCKGISKSSWTGCMEQELQMVQLSATRCGCITIL